MYYWNESHAGIFRLAGGRTNNNRHSRKGVSPFLDPGGELVLVPRDERGCDVGGGKGGGEPGGEKGDGIGGGQ